jgi:hypothetical protein
LRLQKHLGHLGALPRLQQRYPQPKFLQRPQSERLGGPQMVFSAKNIGWNVHKTFKYLEMIDNGLVF